MNADRRTATRPVPAGLPTARLPAAPATGIDFRRRGVAMLAFVAAMLTLSLLILWLSHQVGTASLSYMGHYLSSGALYAADSGGEMTMRELKQAADLDGDGATGTISNDGNAGNNPSLASGSFYVTNSDTKYVSYGVWQGYRRVTEITIQ